MENILLVLNIILAIVLVLLVLMQRSEGGALGIGVSQENMMFSKSAGNFMTKSTAVVATLFILCSLALTIVSRSELILFNYNNYRYKVIPWRDISLSLAAWFLPLVKASPLHHLLIFYNLEVIKLELEN